MITDNDYWGFTFQAIVTVFGKVRNAKSLIFRIRENFLNLRQFIRDPRQFTRDTRHAPIRLSLPAIFLPRRRIKTFQKTTTSCAPFLFLRHFDVSVIYYWTDARQHGIYLVNKNRSGSLGERKMPWEHETQASASTASSSSPKFSRVFV